MSTALSRRKMLGLLAGTGPLLGALPSLFGANPGKGQHLGLGTYSFTLHWSAARNGDPQAHFHNAPEFLDYCHQLGAGGIQVSLGTGEAGLAAQLRAKAEAYQMYVEGDASLPKHEADLERFDSQVRGAKEAGAEVVRTALLSGRRYETFKSPESFRQFADASWKSLALAEPIVRKYRVRLAIENHKDWRIAELLAMIRRLDSEFVGLTVDTGNSLALLEDPLEVVEAFAPLAFSTHLKDMAVQEYEEGFLLSEVPLGEGFLDLKRMVALLRQANPKIHFNLEMITRDPLRIPCLTPAYWATFENFPARQLAQALGRIRRNATKTALPQITGLSLGQQLALEVKNVRTSLAYAGGALGL